MSERKIGHQVQSVNYSSSICMGNNYSHLYFANMLSVVIINNIKHLFTKGIYVSPKYLRQNVRYFSTMFNLWQLLLSTATQRSFPANVYLDGETQWRVLLIPPKESRNKRLGSLMLYTCKQAYTVYTSQNGFSNNKCYRILIYIYMQ